MTEILFSLDIAFYSGGCTEQPCKVKAASD